ncbi:hypothetical protein PENSPDRAFT_51482 [Peniophora sp. CONT]|nr:hypothetical protein PENSPDRAFT_51482 [Peniophora sp. CONT]
MILSGVVSGLLSSWLVGPVYGINAVMSAVIMRKLWPRRASRLFQALMLVTTLLLSSCSAHAFIYLDDIIQGFTLPDEPNSTQAERVNEYFLRLDRPNIIACFFLYGFNGFCNNLFVSWRVYVTWGRNIYLAGFLTSLTIACQVVIWVIGYRFAQGETLEDGSTLAMVITTWALAITIQILGALLIAWITLQTPKVIDNAGNQTRVPLALFYTCVESGFLSMVTEFFLVAYLYRNPPVIFILVALLGQISGFSSFAIILRELQKVEFESARGFVNVTSALAMHGLPRLRGRRSSHSSMGGGEGPGDTVMVAIETSRHEDDTQKPASMHFHPPAKGIEP